MGDVSFNKNKYIFSNKGKRKELNSKIISKQAQFYIKELNLYKINLRMLIDNLPLYSDRNLILNIAYYIVDNEEILDKLLRRKEIPIAILVKNTKVEKRFIEKWKHYIIAYTVLLYSNKFMSIFEYLNISFKELEVLSLVKNSNGDDDIYKGLVIFEGNKSAVILTTKGEFIRIKSSCNNKLGSILSGKEKKGLRHYKHIIIAVLIIFIMTFGTFIYGYNKESSTIIIQSTSKIKLEINTFNKVIYTYSPTEKGKILLMELDLKHKDIGDSLEDIFKNLGENKMIPQDKKIEILITGKRIDTMKFSKLDKYLDKINNDNNTENNIKLIINNSGYEKLN